MASKHRQQNDHELLNADLSPVTSTDELDGIDKSEQVDDGAGPPLIDLFTLRTCGFLLQYFVVGLIYGGLPATTYGVLAIYLNVPGYVYVAANSMATLPWSFKMLYGALHDTRPIRGFRRKPYMAIGWGFCGLALLLLASTGLPAPYWCTDEDGVYVDACDAAHSAHSACANRSIGEPAAPCNPSAAEAGGYVAMLLCLACVGYVCADVAADGLTVTYAQREPLETRGRTQSLVYLVRTCGSIVSACLVGFGMNTRAYGGTFQSGLSFQTVCGIFAVPALAMVPISLWFVQEVPLAATPSLRRYARGVWRLLCSHFFFTILCFSFIYSGVGGVNTPAGVNVQKHWAHVKPMQKQVFGVLSYATFSVGLTLTRRYLLNYSWRRLLVYSTAFIMTVDVFFTSFTVFDVVRNQYFYLGEAFLVDLPYAAQFLVTTFVVVEAADADNGGLVYGLLTTAHNIGLAFSTPLSNQIFGAFKPSLSDAANFIADEPSFRWTVFSSFLLGYLFTVISFGALPLLPQQKRQAQEWKRTWSSGQGVGYASALLLSSTFTYSVSLTILTMIPSTACLRIVGGAGC